MTKGIAFFDFDGTITFKDSLLEFIKFSKGEFSFWKGFLFNTHYILGYKLHLISNQTAKEKILSWFFKGMEASDFKTQCTRFAKERIPSLIRPAALREIKKLQQEQVKVVIVSASPEEWVGFWAQQYQIEVLATRLEYSSSQFTGKIKGLNCHGKEKVRRINEQIDLAVYDSIYAYGDSSGDNPMLALATKSFMKPFRY
jgi:HAD superfamily hydrolase (TIGR01490 family)